MISQITVNKENLLHNLNQLKKVLHKNVGTIAVIKANAYGHGQNEVAKVIEKHVDYFQVDDLAELSSLRKVTKKPILVFGYVKNDELEQAIKLGGILGIYDLKRAQILNEIGSKINKKIKLHIKVDAHLGRQGILLENLPDFLNDFKKLRNVKVTGVYSHFANIEDTSDFTHALKQIDTFQKAVMLFEKRGYKNFAKHMSSTSGVMVYDQFTNYFNLVRLGIGLYGLWPSEDLKNRFGETIELKPVMEWKTWVAQVKEVPKGFTIGYGLTYMTPIKKKIAVVPQGYSDGYDRLLSNTGEVLIKGKRCRVLGRVAMNMFMVDVTRIKDVKVEDEVVLLGKQGKEEITAEEIARKINTINYEVVSRVNPLLDRVVV